MGTGQSRTRPQVAPSAYRFDRYMTKGRWCSLWHQVDLISGLGPKRVAEVGIGSGHLKSLLHDLDISCTTVDIDPELAPDLVGSLRSIPMESGSVDLACAFQVLEHVPYEESVEGFRELCRVSRKDVVISLPNASRAYPLMLTLPWVGAVRMLVPGPGGFLGPMIPSHCWEIGRPGTGLRRVVAGFGAHARLVRTFRVFENPYHQFFHFVRT